MDVGRGGEPWNRTIGNRDVYVWWTSRIRIKHKGPLWYVRCDCWYELFYCNISCVCKIYGKNDCNLQRQVWLQVTELFIAWNRREASLVMCMMAPCTPPNSSVPTENPPILALFLGIFNGPFFKKQEQTLKLWKHPIVHHFRSKHLKTLI